MAARAQDRRQITEVIAQYRRGWEAMDCNQLTAIWDRDYDNSISIPLEAAQPVRGWAGVEECYKNVAAFVERVKTMRISDLSVDVFDDVGYAFCHVHAEIGFKGQGQPLVLDARDTFLLRRTGGAWKVIHSHASRPHLPTG
jgi:ketosteroid isomerase-like protein